MFLKKEKGDKYNNVDYRINNLAAATRSNSTKLVSPGGIVSIIGEPDVYYVLIKIDDSKTPVSFILRGASDTYEVNTPILNSLYRFTMPPKVDKQSLVQLSNKYIKTKVYNIEVLSLTSDTQAIVSLVELLGKFSSLSEAVGIVKELGVLQEGKK